MRQRDDREHRRSRAPYAALTDTTCLIYHLMGTVGDELQFTKILDVLRKTPAPYLSGGTGKEMRFRYWENILESAKSTSAIDALLHFDRALTSVSYEYPLKKGDLVLIDNHRVAHGRRAFPGWTRESNGRNQVSTRLLYNLHVFID
jgi:hypothetical protein